MDLKPLYTDHVVQLQKKAEDILTRLGYDRLLIHSGSIHEWFLDDMEVPFKANPHFLYWLPLLKNPDSFLLVQPGHKPTLFYYLATDFWYPMPEPPNGYWTESFDIQVVDSLSMVKAALPANKTRMAWISPDSSIAESWGIPHVNPVHLLNELHYIRAYKSGYEQACMKQATQLAVKGHLAAKDAFHHGGSEFEIHLAYLKAAKHMENDLPYGNIIALNEHGATLHYMNTDKEPIPEDQLYSFLIDAGARYNGYNADITRTYSFREDEFADLVTAMDKEQLNIISDLKPGESYVESQYRAHHSVARLLHAFEFVNLDPEDIVENKITPTFFPHGIGHLLGIQTHDVAGFSKNPFGDLIPKPEGHPFLRLTRDIEPGMVFTIEPGLYFIDPLLKELKNTAQSKYINWKKVDAFRKYGGVRIEDNVLVTPTGHENFTRDAFASVK